MPIWLGWLLKNFVLGYGLDLLKVLFAKKEHKESTQDLVYSLIEVALKSLEKNKKNKVTEADVKKTTQMLNNRGVRGRRSRARKHGH